MGKALDKYIAEYNDAIKPGLKQPDAAYVIIPEIWIHGKWEEDMGLDGPWQPEYATELQAVAAEDPELFNVLLVAIDMKLKYLDEMEKQDNA